MRRAALVLVSGALLGGAVRAAQEPLQVPAAAEYSARFGETALLVWQGGRIVYERGAERRGLPVRVFSITKSLVALGVFRDIRRRDLALDQRVVHPAARGAVIADLLNQTSGLTPAREEFYTTGLRDKQSVLKGLRRNGAGGRFVYGPSHWEVLAEEVRSQSGGSLSSWLKQRVPGVSADILGRWRKDNSGVFFFSTGARMNAFELLPAGREVIVGLGRGDWPAEVRSWFRRGSDANAMYALGFWLNRRAKAGGHEIEVESVIGKDQAPAFWRDACLSRKAPEDLVAMIGSRGQRVYVVPSRQLVVIRLGTGTGFSDAGFLGRLFGA